MTTKPNFLSIMKIKQLFPRMLLIVGLACTVLVSIPNWSPADPPSAPPPSVSEVLKDGNGNPIGIKTTTTHGSGGSKTEDSIFTAGPNAGIHSIVNEDAKGNIVNQNITYPNGTRLDLNKDASGGGVETITSPNGTIETLKGDSAGNVMSKSIQTTSPDGSITTQTIDPKTGNVTASTIKDSKGNVTTQWPNGTGGLTQSTTDAKTGNVTFKTADGTSTVTDKNGVLISTTTVKPNGKGGFTSVTTDNSGKVISKTTTGPDGKVVTQTGQNKKFSKNSGVQSTGGMQSSQGSGKHKDKQNFQTDIFQHAKEKSHDQNWGSPSGTSGLSLSPNHSSNQSQHRGRR
jgi:hypothetical protein